MQQCCLELILTAILKVILKVFLKFKLGVILKVIESYHFGFLHFEIAASTNTCFLFGAESSPFSGGHARELAVSESDG